MCSRAWSVSNTKVVKKVRCGRGRPVELGEYARAEERERVLHIESGFE